MSKWCFVFKMGRTESYFLKKMACQEKHFQTGGRVRMAYTRLDSPGVDWWGHRSMPRGSLTTSSSIGRPKGRVRMFSSSPRRCCLPLTTGAVWIFLVVGLVRVIHDICRLWGCALSCQRVYAICFSVACFSACIGYCSVNFCVVWFWWLTIL